MKSNCACNLKLKTVMIVAAYDNTQFKVKIKYGPVTPTNTNVDIIRATHVMAVNNTIRKKSEKKAGVLEKKVSIQ